MPNVYTKDGRNADEKKDCTVIALSYACDLDYKEAHDICKKHGRKDGKGFSLCKVFVKKEKIKFLEKGGIKEYSLSLDDKEFKQFVFREKKFVVTYYGRPKMSVGKFRKAHPTGTYLVRVGGHVFCMKDGVIFNQSNEADRISYYHKVVKI